MTLLGIDLGTSSVKAAVFDADGVALGWASRPCAVTTPGPGRAESLPASWWKAVGQAVREACHAAGDLPAPEAIGVAGQMHGVVLVDHAGAALGPAILWPDHRATETLETYRRAGEQTLASLGNPLAPGMMGPILGWLRAHDPGRLRAAARALSPKDWLRLALTGEERTEPSDASATLLWDVERDGWHLPIVERLGLDASLLPDVVDSSEVAGRTLPAAGAALGLPAGVPVVAGAADVAAAIAGAGTAAGERQLGVGTGAQLTAVLEGPRADPARRTHCYRLAGPDWYALAAVQNAGLALEWALGVLGASWEDAYTALAITAPGARGVTFLPYLTGERTPYLEPGLRGAWQGIAHAHTRADLLRAVFEGVAFAIRDARDALADALAGADARGGAGADAAGGHVDAGAGRDAADPGGLRLVGGGSLRTVWQQLLADVLETGLAVVAEPHVTVRGAAVLAAQAVSGEDRARAWRLEASERIVPGEASEACQAAFRRYRARAEAAAEDARAEAVEEGALTPWCARGS